MTGRPCASWLSDRGRARWAAAPALTRHERWATPDPNEHSCSLVALRPGEGPLTEPVGGTRLGRRELGLVPHSGPWHQRVRLTEASCRVRLVWWIALHSSSGTRKRHFIEGSH